MKLNHHRSKSDNDLVHCAHVVVFTGHKQKSVRSSGALSALFHQGDKSNIRLHCYLLFHMTGKFGVVFGKLSIR